MTNLSKKWKVIGKKKIEINKVLEKTGVSKIKWKKFVL